MNRVVPSQPGDDLDALLTAFFRKEMPASWPAFQPPVSRAEAPPRMGRVSEPERKPSTGTGRSWWRGRPLWNSRLALAASIALLVGGALFAPGSLPGVGVSSKQETFPIDPNDGGATRPPILPQPPPAPKGEKDGAKFDSSWGLSAGPDGRVGIEVKVGEIAPSGASAETDQKK
jgi:hypothetical protein